MKAAKLTPSPALILPSTFSSTGKRRLLIFDGEEEGTKERKRIIRANPSQDPETLPPLRWVLAVPPKFSSTGKKRRLFFDTKGDAEAEAKRIKRIRREHGTKAEVIDAELAIQARRAEAILVPHSASLVEAAKFYAAHLVAKAQSVPFTELLTRHLERIESKSGIYQGNVEKIGKKLAGRIGNHVVSTLTPAQVEDALGSLFKTATGFNSAVAHVSPMFSLAVRRGWAETNPCAMIERRDAGVHEIDVLTLAESKALLAACRDYRKDKREEWPVLLKVDATDAVVPVALMLFAGIRPTELTRLEWSDVRLDHNVIRIPARHSKTRTVRHVEIEENLHQWLELVPEDKRTGRLIPSNWRRKWQAVRKQAGIEKRQADVPRHTFASYWLAAFEDVNALRSRMGHRTVDVLFNHYHAVVLKKDALAFWKIVPKGKLKPKALRAA